MTEKQILRSLRVAEKSLEQSAERLRKIQGEIYDKLDLNERALEAIHEAADALSEEY